MPEDFTASTRNKLKVFSNSCVPVQVNLRVKTKSNCNKQATLRADTSRGIFVVDKEKQAKEIQPFESYLIPNSHTPRLKYYNDIASVLYNECFTDFSSKERLQHYLIAERKWRFVIKSEINPLTSKVDNIKNNSANPNSGHSYNIQRLQSIPHDVNSEDVSRCERAITALETMINTCQDIANRLSKKKKTCYLPSPDLMPWGKSTLRYIEVKFETLEQIKGTLFQMLDNVNTVLLDLHRTYNQKTYTKAEEVRKKRRKKEQKRKKQKQEAEDNVKAS